MELWCKLSKLRIRRHTNFELPFPKVTNRKDARIAKMVSEQCDRSYTEISQKWSRTFISQLFPYNSIWHCACTSKYGFIANMEWSRQWSNFGDIRLIWSSQIVNFEISFFISLSQTDHLKGLAFSSISQTYDYKSQKCSNRKNVCEKWQIPAVRNYRKNGL